VKKTSIKMCPNLEDPQSKSKHYLSTRRKHAKILGEENKYPNCAFDPENRTFKSRIKISSQKSTPKGGD